MSTWYEDYGPDDQWEYADGPDEEYSLECRYCNGTGRMLGDKWCTACEGTGSYSSKDKNYPHCKEY